MLSLSYTKWEFFIIELGLYIPMMGFLKIVLGLHEQASWMHTHLVSFVDIILIMKRCECLSLPGLVP